MQPVVVRGVRQSYGGREVLRGVDLVVERGSFHGVIGPNGAGKTTLVEIVQGVRRCEAGGVELLGRAPVPRDPGLLARVGIQPQATAFFSRATVWEHLSTVAAIFGASAARAEQLVELMGLNHVLGSRGVSVRSWRWRRRWCIVRRCCSWMSRRRLWMRRRGMIWWVCWGRCARRGRRWCTRLIIWRRLSVCAMWSVFSMVVGWWPRVLRRRWWLVLVVVRRCCCRVLVVVRMWSWGWVRLWVLSRVLMGWWCVCVMWVRRSRPSVRRVCRSRARRCTARRWRTRSSS